MLTLYKIWYVKHGSNWQPPANSIYRREGNNLLCPMEELLSVLPSRITRDKVVSTDLTKLSEYVKYLNEMADEDESYEIRKESISLREDI